jgi:hypothetical protein
MGRKLASKAVPEERSQSKVLANAIQEFFVSRDESLNDLGEHGDEFSLSHKRKRDSGEKLEASGATSLLRQPGDGILEVPGYQASKISRSDLYKSKQDSESSESLSEGEITSEIESGSEDMDSGVFDQLRSLQEKEATILQKTLSVASNENVEKAQHTKNQLALLDAVYTLRIALQNPLVISNRFPSINKNLFHILLESSSSETKETMVECRRSLLLVLKDICKWKTTVSLKGAKSFNSNLFDFSSKSRGIQPLNELWKYMEDEYTRTMPAVKSELDFWWQKAHLHSQTDLLRKRFKTIQQGLQAQVEYLLQNRERTIGKTKLFRHDLPVLHIPEESESAELQNKTDKKSLASFNCYPHIYDDTDFYQILLRDIIAMKSCMLQNASDPNSTGLATDQFDLDIKQKIKPAQVRKQVTTKGRTLRYEIHQKLANFTASSSWKQFLGEPTKNSLSSSNQPSKYSSQHSLIYNENDRDYDAFSMALDPWSDDRVQALFSSLPHYDS